SSVVDRESARLYAEGINALVRARAEALMDGYELHARLNEDATRAIIQQVAILHEDLVAHLTAEAKLGAWRSRGADAASQAREFGREVDRLSTPILSELACEIEKRRATPKLV